MAIATSAPGVGARRARSRPNWALLVIAVFMGPVGIQAALFPRSFFDDFPGGRAWVAGAGGPYNEHLVRDVGVLFIALAIPTIWTALTRAGDRALATAWIVQGVGHLAFHAAHLHELGAADRVGLVVSLVAIPILGVVALLSPTERSVEHRRDQGSTPTTAPAELP